MTIITDERCTEYHQGGHPEKPLRISGSVNRLKTQTGLDLAWDAPLEVANETLLRAHTIGHVEGVRYPGRQFDSDTPAHDGIYYHALRGVGGAVNAMQRAMAGENAFSLLRPPGHHATKDQAMGFCYFNSLAISILEAQARGAKRVAVFDFDVHHGNGTEDILLNRPDCIFVSVHQSPCYPGTGMKHAGRNCFNYPVRPYTQREPYREALTEGLDQVFKFKPDLIAVSAGFDAYAKDPISHETLEPEDFHWIGSELRGTGIPFYSVLEGGYSDDLPVLIEAYLTGIAGK